MAGSRNGCDEWPLKALKQLLHLRNCCEERRRHLLAAHIGRRKCEARDLRRNEGLDFNLIVANMPILRQNSPLAFANLDKPF